MTGSLRWLVGYGMLAAIAAGSAAAQSDSGNLSFASADANGCKVWAPPQLSLGDFQPRYTGACSNGKAEGSGKLDWLDRHAEMQVHSTWEGYFHQGIFVGSHPFTHSILPEADSNEYIVSLGETPDGSVIAFASNSSAGIMNLCAAGMLGISVNSKVQPADDATVKQAILSAGAALQAVCKNTAQSVQVNAYAKPFAIDATGRRPAEFADCRLDMQTHEISSYSNETSTLARSKIRVAAMMAAMAATQKQFAEFSKRNGVASWVTASQLDENPFRYEGQVVGVVVSLDTMATRDTAIVGGALEGDGASLQLHGVTPDFPGRSHALLVAAKVGKREPLPGQDTNAGVLTSITRIDSITCADAECDDMLSWARGANRIDWGALYVAK